MDSSVEKIYFNEWKKRFIDYVSILIGEYDFESSCSNNFLNESEINLRYFDLKRFVPVYKLESELKQFYGFDGSNFDFDDFFIRWVTKWRLPNYEDEIKKDKMKQKNKKKNIRTKSN